MIAPLRRSLVVIAAGTLAMLATSCGSGGKTKCSDYLSMSGSDRQSAIVAMLQQRGTSNPSSIQVSIAEGSASAYCSLSSLGGNSSTTIDGIYGG